MVRKKNSFVIYYCKIVVSGLFFGNQSNKYTVSALHRGNDNLLRAEFISGKNLLESLPKENFSSQPVVDLWFRQNYGLAQFSIRSETRTADAQ